MNWYTLPGMPSDLLTSLRAGFRRLRVEMGSTNFEEGRSFRLPYEYSVGATPRVLRFTSPTNFRLTEQLLTCDAGNIRLDAYRTATEAGTWSDVPAFAKNAVVDGNLRKVTISTGGTLSGLGPSVDVIRLRTSGSTAQRSTSSVPLQTQRYLPAGTYYLVLSRIDGNETAAGVYLIEWEEDDLP